ncbi:TraB/GumN family protein [Sphingomonas sp.]|uniref:TraB/GumN family protein n=1 Tax=Sphingomonas sp. TaxID=28214 RepID=UPI003D6CB0A8
MPPGFEWRNAEVDRITAESTTLIVEAVDDTAAPIEALTLLKPKGPPLPPLATRVSRSHRAALARFNATLPSEAARLMDKLPTWIAAVAVSFVRDYRDGEIPGPGADDWLEENFRARARPVVEIEDGTQVMANVSRISEADQRVMLDMALDAPQQSRAEMRASIHAWARGEVGPGSALTLDLQSISGSTALSAPLITDRNQAWAGELVRRLKTQRGTMLFAAGIGHFIGPGSVIDLLERRGVTVGRVQ